MRFNRIFCFAGIVSIGLLSCSKDEKPIAYQWVKSNTVPQMDVIYKFKILSDNKLYALGTLSNNYGVWRLDGNNWVFLLPINWEKQLPNECVKDFILYNGSIYISGTSFHKLNLDGTFQRLVPATSSCERIVLGEYRNKIVLTGGIYVNGLDYGTAAFDGTSFSSVSLTVSGTQLKVFNNNLLVYNKYNSNIYQYDGITLSQLNFFSGSDDIVSDDIGNLYTSNLVYAAFNNTKSLVRKWKDGNMTVIGDTIRTFFPNKISSFGNSVVALGNDLTVQPFKYFTYVSVDNSWIPNKSNDSSNNFTDLVYFNGKLFGGSLTGGIYELARK